MMESVIVRLEKAAILRVIHQEPAFSEMFIAHLLGRTIRVEADLVDQLFNSSEKRLERFPSEVNRRGFPNRVCSDS
jgi:CRP/FNR family cyclic AMP-dependent transcriptional regulator